MKMYCVSELLGLLQDWQPKWDEGDLGLAEHLETETGFVAENFNTAEDVLRDFVQERLG